ncbi:MAG: glycosyltransferase family 39 protein, partial [Planctomycetia bacterium]|nr:glycosyltransferase family 39 protein [Planctomycetia bacterium]
MMLQTRFTIGFGQAQLLLAGLIARLGPERILLALLPLVLLAWNPGVFVSPLSIDPWVYFGYYLNLPEFLKLYDGLYYTTRLSTIVPGYLLYQIFPPLLANFVLHLGLYWISVGCLYGTLRDTVERRAAFVAAFLLGCHPYFLNAVGWDYVDGFGIAYCLLTAWLLTKASRSSHWHWYLFAAGAAAFALGVANISYFLFVPFLVGHYVVLNRQWRRDSLLLAACWFGLGIVALQVLLGIISYSLAGRFWFLLPSFTWLHGFTREAGPNPWQLPVSQWWMKASWLVFPFLGGVGAAALLLQRWRRGVAAASGIVVYYQFQLLALLLLFLCATWLARAPMLQFVHYASLLMPATFLALGGQSRALFAGLSPETSRQYTVGAGLLFTASILLGPTLAWLVAWNDKLPL